VVHLKVVILLFFIHIWNNLTFGYTRKKKKKKNTLLVHRLLMGYLSFLSLFMLSKKSKKKNFMHHTKSAQSLCQATPAYASLLFLVTFGFTARFETKVK
jgi:hypothetical protein